MPTEASGAPGRRPSLTRRALLAAAGLGAAAGAGALVAATVRESPAAPGAAVAAVPFHGTQQAGILHPRQTHAHLAAFDFGTRTDRGRATALLLRWSTAAERLTRGEPVGEEISPPGSRAVDTGVALGSGPASLTLTFGFGASFFDRAGLPAARPEALAPLPPSPTTSSTRPAAAATCSSRSPPTTRSSACTPCAPCSAWRTARRRPAG